jgi:hypothetical protein
VRYEPSEQPSDPLCDAIVEGALAPYRALLPPDTLDTFRRQILIALHEHPDAEYLLKQLRPPPVVFESGEVAIVGAAPAGADAPKQGSGGR